MGHSIGWFNDMASDYWQHNKRRMLPFAIDDCPTEIDEVLINGAAICSVAVESKDVDAVLAVIDKLGLHAYENINYLRIIRRIMGLAPLPNEDLYDE